MSRQKGNFAITNRGGRHKRNPAASTDQATSQRRGRKNRMNPGNDPAPLIERLRALLKKGATLQQAGVEVRLCKTTVHEIAQRHNLPRRRRAMDKAKRRKIERAIRAARLTVSELARKYEAAKSTVSVLRAKIIDLEAGTVGTRRRTLKVPERCDGCGHRINIKPCLVCFPQTD